MPAELTADQCPLVRNLSPEAAAQLLDAYNACVRRLAEVAREFPALPGRDEAKKLLAKLDETREGLTRPRYAVGFLGTSSAGKSTIFNRVLREEIAQSGAGDATTSLPSRLLRPPGQTANGCRLVYLTQEQYEDRRKRLAQAIGVGTPPPGNADLLALLDKPEQLRASDTGGKPFLEHDIYYLKSLLDSYDRYGKAVVRPGSALVKEVDFGRRGEFINHATGTTAATAHGASESLLLAEAELLSANPHLPTDLEMCDLPGLNSKRTVDNAITLDFLPRLQGAFVFVSVAENFFNATISEILVRLKHRFGDDLTGRVWVVFNKADTLTKPHYQPPAGAAGAFDNIMKFLKENKVPVSQVCLTTKSIYDMAERAGGTADMDEVVRFLNVNSQSHAPDRPIPATVPGELMEVYAQFLTDGGVGRLRELVQRQVGASVAAAVREDAEKTLRHFLGELNHLAEVEKRRLKGGRKMADLARNSRTTVILARDALIHRESPESALLRELARHLHERLYQALNFSDDLMRVIENAPLSDLANYFADDTATLNGALEDAVTGEVIDKLYARVGERFAPLPALALGGAEGGCQEVWQKYRAEDRDLDTWRGRLFPTFENEELFAGLRGPNAHNALSGKGYLELLREKIAVTVQQTMHAIRVRLRGRLRELERELSLLIAESKQEAATR